METIVMMQARRQIVIGKYLSRQEIWQEPQSVVECVHDVKVYSPFNERKSTSCCYQHNQPQFFQLKMFRVSAL